MTTKRHSSLLFVLSLALAAPLLSPFAGSHASASTPTVSGEVSVRRLVIASDIVEREPIVGAAISTTQDRVYAFVEARNAGAEGRAVRIYFDGPGGRRVGNVTLEVPGTQRRFRTWGYTRYIDTPGTWRAVVVDQDGNELASQEFEVR